jgi:transcription initiation factor TFIIIB Brf1 subunit/transcription initiation factor TFIIB
MKNKQEEVDPIITCHIYNEDHTPITDFESGEVICSNCGMVISEKIEDNLHQERRTNTLDESNKRRDRTGAPTSLAIHDMGLSTIIGSYNCIDTGYIAAKQSSDPITMPTQPGEYPYFCTLHPFLTGTVIVQ